MKNTSIKFFALMGFLFLLFSTPATGQTVLSPGNSGQEQNQPKKEKKGKKVETVNVLITGMTCQAGCANGIRDAVYRIKGVKSSEVSFENQTGTFIFDPDKVSVKKIVATNDAFNYGEGMTGKYKATIISKK